MTVLAPQHLVKQPAESRVYAMDFKNLLGSGEALSAIVSVLATTAGLTISGQAISGSQVQFRVDSGADGVVYRIEVVVTTNQSNTLEGDGLLIVRDS